MTRMKSGIWVKRCRNGRSYSHRSLKSNTFKNATVFYNVRSLLLLSSLSFLISLSLGFQVTHRQRNPYLHVVEKYNVEMVDKIERTASRWMSNSLLKSSETDEDIIEATVDESLDISNSKDDFDLTLALWCAGLAFDAYAEPSDSSRWEKGSKGTNVAFISNAFTRTLYSGLFEVTPIKCIDLPDEDDTAENLMTGGGCDAYLLCSVVEGKMKDDIEYLEKEKFNEGVIGLSSSAHVGRSMTAWSNDYEGKAKAKAKRTGEDQYAYHVKSSWGKGGQAFWNEKPMYLYVSEPEKARLVFSVMDEDLVGEDDVIGSVSKPVVSLLPNVGRALEAAKEKVLAEIKSAKTQGDSVDDLLDEKFLAKSIIQSWEGDIKLTNKPKKKDKGGQVTAGAVAGAMVAGPIGAAAGGFLGSIYEEPVRGKLTVKVNYQPLPQLAKRDRYTIRGGTPGVDWPALYSKHVTKLEASNPEIDHDIAGEDFEFCVYVNNEETECSCGIYRSLEKKLIAVSFRGTTVPKDLLTDASIVQEPWIKDIEEKKDETVPMVHVGFRKSLNSISRRLKELVIAAVPAEEDLSMYDIVVTGHSLGGALATLFTTDVAEYGFDAGRGLPQEAPSEPWWERIAANMNLKPTVMKKNIEPPRPKSLRLYSFGSPRVGNVEFVQLFDSLKGNGYDQAYRVVNDKDVVARLPRTVNALVASIGYDHCGATALVSVPKDDTSDSPDQPILWVEGESDNKLCPVRDGTPLTSPLASGALLGDIYDSVKQAGTKSSSDEGYNWSNIAQSVGDRLSNLSPTDLTSMFGIDKAYAEREVQLIQSITSGEAIAHHLEDEYYQGMGRACGFIAAVGEEVVEIA